MANKEPNDLHGPGRTIPASLLAAVKSFVQENETGEVSLVTAGDVLTALEEITQAQLTADYGKPSIYAGVTSGVTFANGGTYFGAASFAATLPAAAASADIAFTPLRRITAVSTGNLITITVKNVAGSTVATVPQNGHATFDTDGTNWYQS